MNSWAITIRTSTKQEWKLAAEETPTLVNDTPYIKHHPGVPAVPENRSDQRVAARAVFQDIVTSANLESEFLEIVDALDRSSIVELGIHSTAPDWTWDLLWEHVLNLVNSSQNRTGPPAVVIRCFEDGKASTKELRQAEGPFLGLRSTPGAIAAMYPDEIMQAELETMATNLGRSLSSDDTTSVTLYVETADSIQQAVRTHDPGIVHLALIDSGQYNEAAKLTSQNEDGIVCGSDRTIVHVSAEELATQITSGLIVPTCVGCNCYWSGFRIAPYLALHGVQASIGFAGLVDDNAAENLFADFYLAWQLSRRWNLLEAFRLAILNNVKTGLGAGMVLWSRDSLLKPDGKWEGIREDSPVTLKESFWEKRLRPLKPGEGEIIPYYIEPIEDLNYALLHNNGRLFHGLRLRRTPGLGSLKNVTVEVVLSVGNERAQFEASQDVTYSYWVLDNEICLPLTAGILRASRSYLYTTLFVRVSHEGKDIYKKTFRVKLLPIDQWQDDGDNRRWLPSFVYPDDSAVHSIVNGAQRYICAIADRRKTGFSGYDGALSDVETQVRALWWSLNIDSPLNYIAPPLTLSSEAQRIRTPSDLLKSKRGTCLDLALLLTACFEYIDLYAVIFLFPGHAFPGFFTSQGAHADFATRVKGNQSRNWVFEGDTVYELILEFTKAAKLTPVETLVLNEGGGFQDAVQRGKDYLNARDRFECLVDVRLARANNVSPLPIVNLT